VAVALGSLLGLAAVAEGQSGLSQAQRERVDRLTQREESLQVRIVGGNEARPGDYPGAVSISFRKADGSLFSFCGGSLIAARWVMTAAHCDVRVGDVVIVGRHDLTSAAGSEIPVSEVFNHPSYDSGTSDNDIALVRLSQDAAGVGAFALATDQVEFGPAGGDLTVVGWGLLEEGGDASDVLMEVTVPISFQPLCEMQYAQAGVAITGNMLCAGGPGQDSCQGDSGGPALVVDTVSGIERVAGVVSFGIGCARPTFAGVYTRVANYLEWIEDTSGVTSPPVCAACD